MVSPSYLSSIVQLRRGTAQLLSEPTCSAGPRSFAIFPKQSPRPSEPRHIKLINDGASSETPLFASDTPCYCRQCKQGKQGLVVVRCLRLRCQSQALQSESSDLPHTLVFRRAGDTGRTEPTIFILWQPHTLVGLRRNEWRFYCSKIRALH